MEPLMYYRYGLTTTPRGGHYRLAGEISLFGCNVGLLPKMLSTRPKEQIQERWHLQVEKEFAPRSEAVVISLKPNNKNASKALSLYELRDVWGVSDGWTRVM